MLMRDFRLKLSKVPTGMSPITCKEVRYRSAAMPQTRTLRPVRVIHIVCGKPDEPHETDDNPPSSGGVKSEVHSEAHPDL